MAMKKAVPTPAGRIVAAKIAPRIAASVQTVPAQAMPAAIAGATALTPVMAPLPPLPATAAASPPEPVAPAMPQAPVAAKTPEIATTSAPVSPQMVAKQIETLKNEGQYTMENAMKSTEELVSFGQGNVEAFMKSSQIWATGLQDLSKHFAATAQASMDETMATVKAMAAVKSLKEAMDMQSTLAKTAMEKMMAESGKVTDASMKLVEQAIAPLTARLTLATEKFGRTA